MPPRQPDRCTYQEGRRRCPYDGTGTPKLCNAHRIALAEASKPRPPAHVLAETLMDFLQGKPINRDATISAAEDLIGQWTRSRPSAPSWWPPPGTSPGDQGQERRVDPTAQELARVRAACRQVMGFGPREPLDEGKIKTRHRDLVKRYHPDRKGGSHEKMATINHARDILLESL